MREENMSNLPGGESYLPIPTAIAGTAFLLLLCAPASGADIEEQRESLRGLPGVHVLVEKLDADVEGDGLTKDQIQTDVELRLRQSRITVLTREVALRTPGSPALLVNVSTFKDREYPMYAYTISVGLLQEVLLVRKRAGQPITAETWRTAGSIGRVGAAKVREVRKRVLDQVDEFINAYLAVNPR
jgi:hypothetical protein